MIIHTRFAWDATSQNYWHKMIDETILLLTGQGWQQKCWAGDEKWHLMVKIIGVVTTAKIAYLSRLAASSASATWIHKICFPYPLLSKYQWPMANSPSHHISRQVHIHIKTINPSPTNNKRNDAQKNQFILNVTAPCWRLSRFVFLYQNTQLLRNFDRKYSNFPK